MSVEQQRFRLSQPARWIILLAIVFLCLAPGRYDQTVLGWISERFGGTPIKLGVEIKVHPNLPTMRYGFMIVTNLTDETLKIENVRVNHRQDTACSFKPDGAASLGGNPLLQPGGDIMIGTPALISGGCGSIYNVEVTTDKGTVSLNFNWDR